MDNYITGGNIILTEACNLACKYCYEKCRSSKVMTKETAQKIIDFFIKNAKAGNKENIDVTFFGGEPTLNVPVMQHMFDYAVSRCQKEDLKFGCMIVTNATTFTEEYAKFLKHWYKTLGTMNVQLSIDGIPQVQDAGRVTHDGNGTSEIVESVVKKYHEFLKENDIPDDVLNVHGCITKFSLPYLKENYDYFRDVLKIDTIWFMPIHEEPWDDNDVELYGSELQKIADRVVEDCVADKTTKYFDHYSSFKCNTQKPEAPCAAGKTFCSVDTEGNIYACHRFMFNNREDTIGNIDTGIDESKREFFLEYDMSNMYGEEPCMTCTNKACYICIAANYEYNKNMVIGFPKYCKMSKKEDEIRWATLRVLSDKGYAKVPESSCSCGGSCNHDDVVNKIADMYRPVFEELDNKFKKLDELNGHYVEAFKNVDAKADKAIKIAQDALALTGDLFKLIENMYKESNKK